MLKTFEIKLDIEKELYNASNILFSVSRNDLNTIELQFEISQDGAAMDLTGTTIEMAIKKPSGLVVYQECEITDAAGGKASCKLSIQAYVEFGVHTAEVYVRNADQMAITSPFYFMSREAIMETEEIESVNDWSALQQALFSMDKKPILVDGVPAVVPEYVGQMAFDIVGKKAFIANDTTAESWQLLAAGEGGAGTGVVYWADIMNKPANFPAEAHSHAIADVTGLQAALDSANAPAEPVAWVDVQNKPLTFPPDNHMHNIAAITGLQAELDAKAEAGAAPAAHNHAILDVTGLQPALDSKADKGAAPAAHTHTYASITEKPATFPPAAHNHTYAEITQKPATFPPSAHNHAINEITGLQAALDAKADDVPQQATAWADITGKPATFPAAPHTHAWADITGKPATFAPASHTHTIANVTGLQAELDSKADAGAAPTAHSHAIADVTGLQAALDAKTTSAYVDAGDNFIMNTKMAGLTLWKGTQAEYDAIATKSPTTLYFVV